MIEGLLCDDAVCNRQPLAAERVRPHHDAAGLGGKRAHPPSTGAILVSGILQMDRQAGEQLVHTLILVLADDLHKYGGSRALHPVHIPQAGGAPIVSFCFEAIDAADGSKIIGLIDCIFVLVKAVAGEIVPGRYTDLPQKRGSPHRRCFHPRLPWEASG